MSDNWFGDDSMIQEESAANMRSNAAQSKWMDALEARHYGIGIFLEQKMDGWYLTFITPQKRRTTGPYRTRGEAYRVKYHATMGTRGQS